MTDGPWRSFGLGHRILVGTHHKTGTTWMRNIFGVLARAFGWKFFDGEQTDLPADVDIFFQDHSRFDLHRLEPAYKGLHLIRDPRDMILSACFYHQTATEAWLHVRRDKYGGLTYQEKINSYATLEEKIMFEMEQSAYADIREMLAWSYAQPKFFEAKYEDLIADKELALFRRIFGFLGFPEGAIPHALHVAYAHSLFSGNIRPSLHVRSGKPGQWQEHFTSHHRARFLELFGDGLLRLGYEADDEWAGGG